MIRVLPRDAFNDANLLKCIGKLTLMVEDGLIDWLSFDYDGEPFDIRQDESDGSTYVANITFSTSKGLNPRFSRPLNSRGEWPLEMWVGEESFYVFNEKGDFMPSRNAHPAFEG